MERKVFFLRLGRFSKGSHMCFFTICPYHWVVKCFFTICPDHWVILKGSHSFFFKRLCVPGTTCVQEWIRPYLGITCNPSHLKIHDADQECHTLVIHDNFKRPSMDVLFVVFDLYRPRRSSVFYIFLKICRAVDPKG